MSFLRVLRADRLPARPPSAQSSTAPRGGRSGSGQGSAGAGSAPSALRAPGPLRRAPAHLACRGDVPFLSGAAVSVPPFSSESLKEIRHLILKNNFLKSRLCSLKVQSAQTSRKREQITGLVPRRQCCWLGLSPRGCSSRSGGRAGAQGFGPARIVLVLTSCDSFCACAMDILPCDFTSTGFRYGSVALRSAPPAVGRGRRTVVDRQGSERVPVPVLVL